MLPHMCLCRCLLIGPPCDPTVYAALDAAADDVLAMPAVCAAKLPIAALHQIKALFVGLELISDDELIEALQHTCGVGLDATALAASIRWGMAQAHIVLCLCQLVPGLQLRTGKYVRQACPSTTLPQAPLTKEAG